jgi:hypothetical protein
MFNNSLASVDTIAASCGQIEDSKVDETDPHQLQITLTAADCNPGTVIITLTGIHDNEGNILPNATVTIGLLAGDANGDGLVDRNDVALLRAHRGEAVDENNFREDIDTDGFIDPPDFRIVKSRLGTMLPP